MSNERPFDGEHAGMASRVPVEAYEVEREAVIAMLERERRAFTSSLIALSILAIGITMLPSPALMVVLLALRTASFLFTRSAAARLERKVRMRQPLRFSRGILFVAMSLTGVTLALLLWPQPADAPVLAVALIQIVIIVAITLISVTLAALPASRDAMLFSFLLTASALIFFHPAGIEPMFAGVIALGVVGIRIYSANTGDHMRSSARVLVENRELSEDLAEALAHAEFLSWRDPLTGLFNRRMLFEETRKERSARSRHLLTIDLDRFKAINDTFGHGVGDHVLIAAADTIRDWSGSLGDLDEHPAFRLGGEEFLVILRGFDDTAALDQAERLRMQIASLESQFTDHPGIAISASIGLAAWRFGESLDDALMRADIACYEAKNTGRNKVRRAA